AEGRHHFLELTGGEINPTELVSALIDQKSNFVEGLLHVQEKVEGSMSILLLTPEGMYAARDRYGRTPIVIGKKDSGYCAAFEAFSYLNLGYTDHKALGPGEIAFITPESYTSLSPPREEMRMCAFLWVYYGYPASSYEGKSVEEMRYDSGKASAAADRLSPDSTYPPVVEADIVAGIPDSGTAHAIGYANASGVPFNRPFIKYTPTWPRSFTPPDQTSRSLIARMKLIPVDALIRGKRIILTEDSIVRGTQLNGVTKLLYQCGAKEIHMRVSCPPNMFTCPYLNFTRSTAESNLIARRSITKLTEGGATWTMEDYTNPDSPAYAALLEEIREELGFTSLGYNRLEDTIGAIGLPKCRLCTYCWNGKG
ncbi:MAG: amidophosphoribosyltransferase, partial [Oscillospiraceae bacterium]|nr:amidophosphoribosyltransferase [Oscillospiraceae bacterium]